MDTEYKMTEYFEGVMQPKICTCGRSATGYCTGLHKLTEEEWDAMVFDESFLNEQGVNTDEQ